MAERGVKFGFFRYHHVRIDKKNNNLLSTGPMTTKFGNQVHLGEMAQMKLIKHVLVTSSHLHDKSVYSHQTRQSGNLT